MTWRVSLRKGAKVNAFAIVEQRLHPPRRGRWNLVDRHVSSTGPLASSSGLGFFAATVRRFDCNAGGLEDVPCRLQTEMPDSPPTGIITIGPTKAQSKKRDWNRIPKTARAASQQRQVNPQRWERSRLPLRKPSGLGALVRGRQAGWTAGNRRDARQRPGTGPITTDLPATMRSAAPAVQ